MKLWFPLLHTTPDCSRDPSIAPASSRIDHRPHLLRCRPLLPTPPPTLSLLAIALPRQHQPPGTTSHTANRHRLPSLQRSSTSAPPLCFPFHPQSPYAAHAAAVHSFRRHRQSLHRSVPATSPSCAIATFLPPPPNHPDASLLADTFGGLPSFTDTTFSSSIAVHFNPLIARDNLSFPPPLPILVSASTSPLCCQPLLPLPPRTHLPSSFLTTIAAFCPFNSAALCPGTRLYHKPFAHLVYRKTPLSPSGKNVAAALKAVQQPVPPSPPSGNWFSPARTSLLLFFFIATSHI